MPSGAPTNAEYLLLAANAVLTQARIFDIGGLLVAVDGGPAGNYTVSLDESDLVLANLPSLDAELAAIYLPKSILSANGDLLTRIAGTDSRLAIGNTGDQLTVSGGLPAWTAPTVFAPAYPAMPQLSGRYYAQPTNSSALATFVLAINTLYLTPFYVPTSTNYNQIAVRQTAGTTPHYHLGVYGPWTGSLASLPQIVDTGALNPGSGAQDVTATINITLAPGWYFTALVTDVAGTIRALDAGATMQQFGFTGLNDTTQPAYLTNALTYGNLPSPGPSAPTYVNGTQPRIYLRPA